MFRNWIKRELLEFTFQWTLTTKVPLTSSPGRIGSSDAVFIVSMRGATRWEMNECWRDHRSKIKLQTTKIKDQSTHLQFGHLGAVPVHVRGDLHAERLFVIALQRSKIKSRNLKIKDQILKIKDQSHLQVELAADALGPLAVQAERLETNCIITLFLNSLPKVVKLPGKKAYFCVHCLLKHNHCVIMIPLLHESWSIIQSLFQNSEWSRTLAGEFTSANLISIRETITRSGSFVRRSSDI